MASSRPIPRIGRRVVTTGPAHPSLGPQPTTAEPPPSEREDWHAARAAVAGDRDPLARAASIGRMFLQHAANFMRDLSGDESLTGPAAAATLDRFAGYCERGCGVAQVLGAK